MQGVTTTSPRDVITTTISLRVTGTLISLCSGPDVSDPPDLSEPGPVLAQHVFCRPARVLELSAFTKRIEKRRLRSVREGRLLFSCQRHALSSVKHPEHSHRVLGSCPEGTKRGRRPVTNQIAGHVTGPAAAAGTRQEPDRNPQCV